MEALENFSFLLCDLMWTEQKEELKNIDIAAPKGGPLVIHDIGGW